jgi:hypothetical protein
VPEDGAVRAEAPISGRRAYLAKVYIHAADGILPRVEYVELFGTHVKTGEPLRERIVP